jgi:hypothetical protein
LQEDYAVRTRIAPSAALEAAVEEFLAEGLGDGERLAEIGRLGARMVPRRAVEEEVTAFLAEPGTSGRQRRADRGTGTGRAGADRRGRAGDLAQTFQ